MLTKANYIARRKASLNVLDRQIVRLRQFCDGNPDCYDHSIDELQATRDKAASLLRRIRSTNNLDWIDEETIIDLEQAWAELRNAVLVAIASTYSDAR